MDDFGSASIKSIRTVSVSKLANLMNASLRPPSLPGELDRLLPYPLTVCVWGCETLSESNTRCHHMVRYRRFKAQSIAVSRAFMGLHGLLVAIGGEVLNHGGKLAVTFVRIGKKKLDSDNLTGAFKAIRDTTAGLLVVDDGHPGIDWRYPHDRQQVGSPACIITIEAL